MIRLANSSMLLSSLLGLGRQGGVGDGAANLVRTAAMRADPAPKAAPAKTAELPAKTATQRPAVTVSLSRMAQAAQAAQAQPAAAREPTAEAAPRTEPDRPAPPPETKSGPPRTANGTYFTDDEQRKLQAVIDFSRAQHQDLMRFRREGILPSEDVSAMTPAQARQRLDDLSVLKRFDEVRIQIGDPSLASPTPFSIAANNGDVTESMDTYMGWLKGRAAQSQAPATPGLNIQV